MAGLIGPSAARRDRCQRARAVHCTPAVCRRCTPTSASCWEMRHDAPPRQLRLALRGARSAAARWSTAVDLRLRHHRLRLREHGVSPGVAPPRRPSASAGATSSVRWPTPARRSPIIVRVHRIVPTREDFHAAMPVLAKVMARCARPRPRSALVARRAHAHRDRGRRVSGRRDLAMRRLIALLLAAPPQRWRPAWQQRSSAAQRRLRGRAQWLVDFVAHGRARICGRCSGESGCPTRRGLCAACERCPAPGPRCMGRPGCSSSARKRRASWACPTSGCALHPSRTNKPDSSRRRRRGATPDPGGRCACSSTCPEGPFASLSVGISNGPQSPLLIDEVSVLPHASLAPASSTQERRPAKVLEAALRGDPDTGPACAKRQLDGDRALRATWQVMPRWASMRSRRPVRLDVARRRAHRIPARDGSAAPSGSAPATEGVRHAAIGAASYLSIPTFGSMDEEASLQFMTRLRDLIRGRGRASGPLRLDSRPARQRRWQHVPDAGGAVALLGDGTLGSS